MLLPLLLALLAPQDGWWDSAWPARRKITVRNGLDRPLPGGTPVEIEIDPAFLELTNRARADLADLVVVHVGRRRPHAILPAREAARAVLCFALADGIAAGAVDGRYALYYGHASAAPPAGSPFDEALTFDDADALRTRLKGDDDLRAGVRDGVLEIRDVDGRRSPLSPARLTLAARPSSDAFALALDVEIDPAAGPMPWVGVEVEVAAEAPADAAEVDRLIAALGDPDFEARHAATQALVRHGPAAAAALEAAARSADAEVRWRAESALRDIRKAAPAPLLRAGIGPDEAAKRAAFTSMVGSAEARQLSAAGPEPLRVSISVERDERGHATIRWNGAKAQTGMLPGKVARISIVAHKLSSSLPAPARIDNLVLRRWSHPDKRPATSIEAEENSP